MLENPQIAHDLIYDYRGIKIKGQEMRRDGIQFIQLAKL